MIKILPRAIDNTQTIQIKFMRKMEYKNPSIRVRPKKILEAVEYLSQKQLFKDHDIQISTNWYNNQNMVDFVLNKEDVDNSDTNIINDDDDYWDERDDFEKQECGNTDTLLEDFSTSVAGEGHIPLSILYDKDNEELSFPTIYAGERRNLKTNMSITNIYKSEIRRYDRRACCVPKLFYMFKKSEIQRVSNSISTCLRKKHGDLKPSDIINNTEKINNLLQHDSGYRFLKSQKKKLTCLLGRKLWQWLDSLVVLHFL